MDKLGLETRQDNPAETLKDQKTTFESLQLQMPTPHGSKRISKPAAPDSDPGSKVGLEDLRLGGFEHCRIRLGAGCFSVQNCCLRQAKKSQRGVKSSEARARNKAAVQGSICWSVGHLGRNLVTVGH